MAKGELKLGGGGGGGGTFERVEENKAEEEATEEEEDEFMRFGVDLPEEDSLLEVGS